LDKEKDDNFEQGDVDTFEITDTDVGEIKKINISHNGEGLGEGWYLKKVTVLNKNENRTYE
jgi:hypothetical protein